MDQVSLMALVPHTTFVSVAMQFPGEFRASAADSRFLFGDQGNYSTSLEFPLFSVASRAWVWKIMCPSRASLDIPLNKKTILLLRDADERDCKSTTNAPQFLI